jgi:glyoxylase-like metal-dependent hydrolase (beta-lactamase superfamily II)
MGGVWGMGTSRLRLVGGQSRCEILSARNLKALRESTLVFCGHEYTAPTVLHNSACVEYVVCVGTGDTLFAMGCGRLFEGRPEQMWKSLSQMKATP